jgi:hypothetical protein
MDPAWIVAAVSLATVIAGIMAWLIRGSWRLAREFLSFMEEWKGVPTVHGRPARPGVLDRLSSLESVTGDISLQVHMNGGHSVKDIVNRIESKTVDLQKSVDDLTNRVNRLPGGQP